MRSNISVRIIPFGVEYGCYLQLVLAGSILIIAPTFAGASFPINVSMLEVVQSSDHVLIVQVVGVDMIDEYGTEITDLSARTGPGSKSSIRLVLSVLEVYRTTASEVPSELRVPLDSAMHYSLGQIQEAHKGGAPPEIAVLAGDDFHSAFSGVFRYPMSDLEGVLVLYDQERTPQ